MSRLNKILLSFVVGVVGVMLITVSFMLPGTSTIRANESSPIYHKQINYPANAQPIAIQCGDQPCVIFYDVNLEAAVALMVDGSTITIKPEVAEPND